MLQAEFLDDFKPRYQRNNKTVEQKNLRCFPQCSAGAHVAHGFCGRPVVIALRGLKVASPSIVIRAYGELIEQSRLGHLGLKPGDKLKLQVAQEQERRRESGSTSSNASAPWLRGDIKVLDETDGTLEMVFNRQLWGWHYEWRGNKHTCDEKHVFRANVFLQAPGSDDLEFVGSCISPSFQIYSRRRQRGDVDPCAAASVGKYYVKRKHPPPPPAPPALPVPPPPTVADLFPHLASGTLSEDVKRYAVFGIDNAQKDKGKSRSKPVVPLDPLSKEMPRQAKKKKV